jgi:magnesium chelatase family protein
VPRENADEAALVVGLEVIALGTLADVAALAGGVDLWKAPDLRARLRSARDEAERWDLADVRGQASARRALEIAAAGGHHLLMSGPPGSGKTMLARRLPGILPPLEVEEALEVTRVWSVAGLSRGLVSRRPFRAPHHGISLAGMTGGGSRLRPGEISRATNGVLYLDEMTEFRRDALESLRQPLEEGRISVVRLHASADMPAAFMLVASMNPCPCGYHGSRDERCGCTPLEVRRYRGKLSGPLLDRFDLVIEVPPLDVAALSGDDRPEASSAVRRRVLLARERQRRRYGAGGPTCNARLEAPDLVRHCRLGSKAGRMLALAFERLGLSARGFDRVRRVARTLADLAATERIDERHVAEALRYRRPGNGGNA